MLSRLFPGFAAIVLGLALVLPPTAAIAAAPNDHVALTGITTGKGFFDLNVAEADRLLLYLKVITQTRAGLLEQKVAPDLIVAFRGPSVKLIVASDDEKGQAIATLIRRLQADGVRFEACAVALRLFDIDPGRVIPEVAIVGNTFISSIGYQGRGYALIPIQ